MKNIIILAALCAAFASCTTGNTEPVKPTMRKYKYKVITSHINRIQMLQIGYKVGDTIDVSPTGAVTMAVVTDTL